ADAQTLGGLPPSAFLLAAPAVVNSASTSATTAPQAAPVGTKAVTTAGGTVQALAKFDGSTDVASSQVFDTGTTVGIGTSTPTTKLDVKGAATVHGTLIMPATGGATAAGGKNSQPQKFTASVFNGTANAAVGQTFQWQAEPAGNNTGSPSASLNLLFAHAA